jgi:septum formation protein
MKKIVLASKSIDRKKIFNRLNIPFETIITDIDEGYYKEMFSNPVELAKEIAKAKALKAKDLLRNKNIEVIIIAADTIVEFKGKIIGKAKNKAQAFQILKSLINRSHNLITGVAITELNNPKIVVDYDCTIVTFLDISDNEIRNYINTEEWKGRAGAYSIRDRASLFIKEIRGSPSNVIGLPLEKIFEILKKDFGLNLLDT